MIQGLRTKDTVLSARIGRRIDAVPKACWPNSQRALSRCHKLLPPGTVYVEGWAVMDDIGIAIEHGWLETPDGTVIDVTLPERDGTYYAGTRWDLATMRATVRKAHRCLLTEVEHRRPLLHPPYRLAYLAASLLMLQGSMEHLEFMHRITPEDRAALGS